MRIRSDEDSKCSTLRLKTGYYQSPRLLITNYEEAPAVEFIDNSGDPQLRHVLLWLFTVPVAERSLRKPVEVAGSVDVCGHKKVLHGDDLDPLY